MEDLRGMMTQFINGRLIIPTSFEECLTYAQQILFLAMHKQNKLVAGDNITITPNEDGTYTITSTGGASLDIDVQATIDANVGTPSVTIDTTDLPDGRTRYTFNFHNMKGEQGQQGPEGFSPEVHVFDVIGGHEVQITDSHGVSAFAVMDGAPGPAGADGQNGADGTNGTDGVSPTVSTSAIPNGTRVTITDAQGSHSFDVMNGQNGQNGTNGTDGTDGTDGVSPIISSAPITGGTRVTIIDAQGTTTFDVMNGVDGQTGQPGQPGPAGQDGADGSLTWVTTVASTTPDYTWNVSDLVGVSGKTPKINDIIIQNINGETYMYVIDSLNDPYVSASRIASLRGAQGVQGQPGQNGTDGTNGTNGTNGVSPVVVVTQITGGHQIQITDAQGTSTFNVMDGTDGTDGTIVWTLKSGRSLNYNSSDGWYVYTSAIDGPSGATPKAGDVVISVDEPYSQSNAYLTYVFRVTSFGTPFNNTAKLNRERALTCIPTGGTTGQVLAKRNNNDFATEWVTPSSGGGGQPISLGTGVNIGNPLNFNPIIEDGYQSGTNTDIYNIASLSDGEWEDLLVYPENGRMYLHVTVTGNRSLLGTNDEFLIEITPNLASVADDNYNAIDDEEAIDLVGKVVDHFNHDVPLSINIPLKGGFFCIKELKLRKGTGHSGRYNVFDAKYEYYISSTFYTPNAFTINLELVSFT